MKQILFLISLFVSFFASSQQRRPPIDKGRIITEKIIARSIKDNPAGEDPMRSVTIYLPPGYEISGKRYPVIYYLHGFRRTDSFCISVMHLNELMDTAINNGIIRSVILVIPNSYTSFGGSFYTNSLLTGNWADYIAKDIVQYVDSRFRTLATKNSRGLCGHSMGGNGAIKIVMQYDSIFSSIYALSPARLNWGQGLTINSNAYKIIKEAKNHDEVARDFFALEVTDLARTYSPDLRNPPFYANFPFRYIGDSVITDTITIKRWDANFPINMIRSHIKQLKKLRAIKFDWGRNDQFPFIPVACHEFSKQLEAAGIAHFAEEYLGDHSNTLLGTSGRIYTELLPFFNKYLDY